MEHSGVQTANSHRYSDSYMYVGHIEWDENSDSTVEIVSEICFLHSFFVRFGSVGEKRRRRKRLTTDSRSTHTHTANIVFQSKNDANDEHTENLRKRKRSRRRSRRRRARTTQRKSRKRNSKGKKKDACDHTYIPSEQHNIEQHRTAA